MLRLAQQVSERSRLARPKKAMPDGHLGPFEVKGTLTSEQRAEIKAATGCSAAVRERGQWGTRMLTVTGPCDQLEAAHQLARQKITENGDDGGRAPAEPAQRADPAQPRNSSWRRGWQDWPSRAEMDNLKKRLEVAEERLASESYRIQVLEGWYWWCNQYEGGYPNAAQSWYPNPANGYWGSSSAKPAKEKRKKKPRSPSKSSATKSDGRGPSQASSQPTLLLEAVPEKREKVKKKRKENEGQGSRTQWKATSKQHSETQK